ncbi:MAG TPA: hypothetical protein VMM82_07130, partial [Spirochaetia bacterium]|nr:hypothetical protein [Spirochaetia bacterium]
MGTQVGRIEKEFVFKALVDDATPCDVHGAGKEAQCKFAQVSEDRLEMTPVSGPLPAFQAGEEVRVFFYLKNNYHTFSARLIEAGPEKLVVQHPRGVYKNLQRKYERVKPGEDLHVSFSLKGTKIELNFPKSERFSEVEPPETSATFDPRRIQTLVRAFREKMSTLVSDNRIVM